MCETSVNLMPCCIKHTLTSFWHSGTPRASMYISIILKPKIDNHSFSRRKNSGFGVQSDKEGGDLTQFDKEGVGNIRGLHKKGRVRTPPLCQL